LEEARSIKASGGFFIALPMPEATRFINHTDPTPLWRESSRHQQNAGGDYLFSAAR
jgi:hypothetical protein